MIGRLCDTFGLRFAELSVGDAIRFDGMVEHSYVAGSGGERAEPRKAIEVIGGDRQVVAVQPRFTEGHVGPGVVHDERPVVEGV